MNYCFMTFSTPELTLDQVLETAKKYGYAGIEPRLDSGHKHGIEVATSASDRGALREQAEVSGIALACIATSLTYADPAKTDDMIAQTHERIDLAGDVGAPAMRVFGGRIPDGIEREAAIGIVADSLGSVADHAGERGVTICMETHDDWCAPAHVAEVLSRVNHAHIAANWDIMHPVRRADTTIDASFETLKPWIRHLHVHDGMKEGGMLPVGDGIIDHRRAIELLLSVNYQGFISGEWINWEPCDVHLPRELATLKRYEKELS